MQRVYVVRTVVSFASRITDAKASDVRAWLKGVVSPAAPPLARRVEIPNGNDAVYRMCVPPNYNDVTRDVLPPPRSADSTEWSAAVGGIGAAVGSMAIVALVVWLLRVRRAEKGENANTRTPPPAPGTQQQSVGTGAGRPRRARAYEVAPVGRAAGRAARGSMAAAFAPRPQDAKADDCELSYSLLHAIK